MFHTALTAIRQAYSGDAAKDQVAIISRLHRIQASPGLRDAAHVVFNQLQAWGLAPEYLQVPANTRTRYWGSSLFQEWEATQGTLHLLGPSARKLADYRAVPLSLIPRSVPFQGTLDVVAIDGGDDAGDYDGIDVRGKIVLTNTMPMRARRLAVQRFGAAGLIYDGMSQAPPVRLAYDLPDALQYTSFWWWDDETPDTFGFVVSQKVGAWLRDLIRHSREPVQVQIDIQSRFFDGTLDGVTVCIPGETDEEVVVVSHLCHPAPCANDNASGVGCALELARTLHTLIQQGELARPRRGIRFLWVAEMTGTYAYLATHEDRLARLVAGINLDMVGQDQAQCGSVLLLERPPAASASFVDTLLARVHAALADTGASYSGQGSFALHRYASVPFNGGSDHYIFSDPTVGVPMPMLIQWPDKFYHTTADTLEKTDPQSLALAGILAGTYAYWIATADASAAAWLADEIVTQARGQLARLIQDGISAEPARAWASVQRQVEFAADRTQAALRALTRLAENFDVTPWLSDVDHLASSELARGTAAWPRYHADPPQAAAVAEAPVPDDRATVARQVPRRLFRGPVEVQPNRLAPDDQEAWWTFQRDRLQSKAAQATVAQYWTDGQRTLAEIDRLVALETGASDLDTLVTYFEFLAKAGLCVLTDQAPTPDP